MQEISALPRMAEILTGVWAMQCGARCPPCTVIGAFGDLVVGFAEWQRWYVIAQLECVYTYTYIHRHVDMHMYIYICKYI